MESADMTPAEPPRIPFRDGQGGDMPIEWAAYMLAYWYEANKTGKRPSFSDTLQLTVAHFMMGA